MTDPPPAADAVPEANDLAPEHDSPRPSPRRPLQQPPQQAQPPRQAQPPPPSAKQPPQPRQTPTSPPGSLSTPTELPQERRETAAPPSTSGRLELVEKPAQQQDGNTLSHLQHPAVSQPLVLPWSRANAVPFQHGMPSALHQTHPAHVSHHPHYGPYPGYPVAGLAHPLTPSHTRGHHLAHPHAMHAHHPMHLHYHPHSHQRPPTNQFMGHYGPAGSVPIVPYDYGHPVMQIMPHRFQPPNAMPPEGQLRSDGHLIGPERHFAPPPLGRDTPREQDEGRKSDESSAGPQQVPSLSGSPRPLAKPKTHVGGIALPVHGNHPLEVPRIAYVNGVILAADEARVSITDFGFSSGCAIVEEMLLSNGEIVRLDAHIAKLKSSAGALGLPMPLSTLDLQAACRRIVATNQDGPRAALYIQLTFGAYGVRSRYLPPTRAVIPTLVIHSQPLQPVPPSHIVRGMALFATPDNRPMLSAPGQKSAPYVSSSQLPELLALRAALANGFDEAVLFDPATDEVTGTTQGNIFCVKFGVIYTPPTFGRVPDGVIRSYVLDVCIEQEIDVREVSITMPFLSSAAEVFCISTLDQILPVRVVGEREIGQDGSVPGPVTSKIMSAVASEKKLPDGGDERDRSRQPEPAPVKRVLHENSDDSTERRNKVRKSGS